MKRLVVSLFAMLMIGVAAQAQENHKRHGKHHQKEVAEKLNFSEDQKTQLKTIHEETRKQLEELKKNDQISVKEYNERKKAIHEGQQTKMKALLSPEQKQKMEQMKQERMNKHKGEKGEKGIKGDKVKAGKSKADKVKASKKAKGEKMKAELGLSDEQVAKMKAARSEMAVKAKSIRDNKALTAEQKKEQMKALSVQRKEQTKSILTKEQLEKMESMKTNRKHKSAR